VVSRHLSAHNMTDSTKKATSPKPTKSQNFKYLSISQYKFKWKCWFHVNLCREIWASRFGGFQECGIFSWVCHTRHAWKTTHPYSHATHPHFWRNSTKYAAEPWHDEVAHSITEHILHDTHTHLSELDQIYSEARRNKDTHSITEHILHEHTTHTHKHTWVNWTKYAASPDATKIPMPFQPSPPSCAGEVSSWKLARSKMTGTHSQQLALEDGYKVRLVAGWLLRTLYPHRRGVMPHCTAANSAKIVPGKNESWHTDKYVILHACLMLQHRIVGGRSTAAISTAITTCVMTTWVICGKIVPA